MGLDICEISNYKHQSVPHTHIRQKEISTKGDYNFVKNDSMIMFCVIAKLINSSITIVYFQIERGLSCFIEFNIPRVDYVMIQRLKCVLTPAGTTSCHLHLFLFCADSSASQHGTKQLCEGQITCMESCHISR